MEAPVPTPIVTTAGCQIGSNNPQGIAIRIDLGMALAALALVRREPLAFARGLELCNEP